jgi:hypothetical protein
MKNHEARYTLLTPPPPHTLRYGFALQCSAAHWGGGGGEGELYMDMTIKGLIDPPHYYSDSWLV